MKSQFLTINQMLKQYRDIWSPAPFKIAQPPWLTQYPHLKPKLEAITQQQLELWQKDISGFADYIADDFPDALALIKLAQIPSNPAPTNDHERGKDFRFFKAGIKQRKWQQIQDFSAALPWHHLPLLEWCSGKGYLAQYYSLQHDQAVECVEFNQSLCQSGKKHATKFKLDARFYHLDVLRDNTDECFTKNKIAAALHACGQLHINLINQCVKHKTPYLAVAPCCYHLTDIPQHQPLSIAAKNTQLIFSRDEMRLALEQPITGSARELEQTHNLNIKRLAFDEYLQSTTGSTDYTNMPSLSRAWANQPLQACVKELAKLKGISLDAGADINWQHWQTQGETRYFCSQRYSLMRYLFRRLIELWLVMDRAIYLQEQGYNVNLTEFCSIETSPRNLMINAQLKDNTRCNTLSG